MVTLKASVAKAVVLTGTVSNRLAARQVRPEIAERVRVARIALDCPPTRIVRSFHGPRTQAIGLVVPDTANPALDHQHIACVVGLPTCASATSG
jgi:DNA-binding LacI/PurR family transcriptional regulator